MYTKIEKEVDLAAYKSAQALLLNFALNLVAASLPSMPAFAQVLVRATALECGEFFVSVACCHQFFCQEDRQLTQISLFEMNAQLLT